MRRKALPSVSAKPRSSGSASTVAPCASGRRRGGSSACRAWSVLASFSGSRNAPFMMRTAAAALPRRRRIGSCGRSRQTRRRFLGRQPLCGIGVTSRIDVTMKPAACSARSADSRPDPGPETSTSSVRMPCSCALRAASSARHLRGIRGGLARTLEPHRASRRPRDRIALRIRDGDHRIVERRRDVSHARHDILALAAANASCFFGHSTCPSGAPVIPGARVILLAWWRGATRPPVPW